VKEEEREREPERPPSLCPPPLSSPVLHPPRHPTRRTTGHVQARGDPSPARPRARRVGGRRQRPSIGGERARAGGEPLLLSSFATPARQNPWRGVARSASLRALCATPRFCAVEPSDWGARGADLAPLAWPKELFTALFRLLRFFFPSLTAPFLSFSSRAESPLPAPYPPPRLKPQVVQSRIRFVAPRAAEKGRARAPRERSPPARAASSSLARGERASSSLASAFPPSLEEGGDRARLVLGARCDSARPRPPPRPKPPAPSVRVGQTGETEQPHSHHVGGAHRGPQAAAQRDGGGADRRAAAAAAARAV
jgi:hypothetical protein